MHLASQEMSGRMTSPRRLLMLLCSTLLLRQSFCSPYWYVSRKYGKINHIVNNGQSFCISHLSSVRAQRLIAGFTFDKMLHTMPDDSWDIIMKIHVRAPFRLIRQAAPYFRLKVCPSFLYIHVVPSVSYVSWYSKPEARENRSIINISSVSGLHGNVGQANYAAAKAAVVGLTKTIAKEWGPFGVRANTVAFGLIHTRYASHC